MVIENGKPELTLDEIMAIAILKNVQCPEGYIPCGSCPMAIEGNDRYICISHQAKSIFDRESRKANVK